MILPFHRLWIFQANSWINIRPEFQRRLRWDKKISINRVIFDERTYPTDIFYEYDIARYEVMDGQQRLNTIIEFYNNEFPLFGLNVWSSLNGKRHKQLPPRIRRGLDRGKISSIILVTDLSIETDAAIGDLRTQVLIASTLAV